MKKLLVIPFILASFLYAKSDVYPLNVKQEQALYKTGLDHYKAKNYEKSYEIFNKLFQTNLDDILVNYYLGRSAFFLKKYEFAVSAYDRILILQPNNNKVRLELGQTYIAMGLWGQALDEYTKVSKGKLPKQVEQRVQKTIALLKNKQSKSLFTVYTLFAMIYDSNINNATNIDTFDIYSPNLDTNLTVSSNASKESTMIYQAVASFNYKYKLNDELIWDNNFSSINLKYDDHKEKDVNILSFNSGPLYYTKDYKLGLSFIVDKVLLNHQQHQFNYYVKPEFTKNLSEKSIYIASLKLGRVNYKDTPELNAKVVEFSNNFKYLTNNYGLFNFKATFGKEIETDVSRNDITYSYSDFSLGNSVNVLEDFTLMTNISYKISDFADYNDIFQSSRRDETQDYSIALEKQIQDSTVVNLGTTYTKRDSNQEPSSFDKYVIKLSLYLSF